MIQLHQLINKLNFLKIKKKILYGITVIAIAAVAAWNVSVNLNSQKNELSDISLANIEALASENSSGCKLSLLYICTTPNSDHYLYRNVNN
jgi:chromate transport protein ChrA